jgi:chromosome segregation ATPase
MNTTENTHLLDYVIDAMRKGADELEKFQVQASLGKMEAMETYEELKKSYAHYTNEAKVKIEQGKEKYQELLAKVQDLQVQFTLGKADTIEAFQEQRKKIMLAIHEVQVAIQTNPTFIKAYALMLETLEKIKVKLDILAEQLEPTREKVKTVHEEKKEQIEKAIQEFREKFNDSTGFEDRLEYFQKEMSLAYDHFRKAFVG